MVKIALLADQPRRGEERALGEDAAIARFVHEAHLLERRVEDQLVRARAPSRCECS